MAVRGYRWTTFFSSFLAVLLLNVVADAQPARPSESATPRGLFQPLHLVGRDPIEAAVVEISGSRLDVLTRESSASAVSSRSFPLEDVAYWGRRRSFRPIPQLLLRDGGVLATEVLEIDRERWRGGPSALLFASVTPIWTRSETPAAALAGVIFQPAHQAKQRDALASTLRDNSIAGVKSQLWIDNGNTVRGQIQSVKATLDGLQQWTMKVRERAVPIEHARVKAVKLSSPIGENQGVKPSLALGFLDGSHLLCEKLRAANGSVRLDFSSGGFAEIDDDAFYENLCMIRTVQDSVQYLADMEPAEQRHQPFLSVSRAMRRGQCVLGGLARVGDGVFDKAMGVCSKSFLVYSVGKQHDRFVSDVALDSQADGKGSVVFQVFAESDGGWQLVAKSSVIRGRQTQQLVADLAGATKIALVVDYAERGDTNDFANWINARLERSGVSK